MYVKEYGKITNTEFQQLTSASKRTITGDLKALTEKGLLIQKSTTGKGTQYVLQRGSKGAEGAKSAPVALDSLDLKISLLENDLSIIDTNDEVRWRFNSDVFAKIFDGWFTELLSNVIAVAQKFNKLFISPRM